MNNEIRYRGRIISVEDIEFIRRLISDNPQLSRRRLSVRLCEAWNWVQPNGALRDMVCRGMMLQRHRSGLIRLPEPRQSPTNPLVRPRRPQPMPACDPDRIEGNLSQLGELEFRQVRPTPQDGLFGSLIQSHHYLGYTQPVGEHLKFIIYARGVPVACMAWSSAPRHLGPRDRFIRWSGQQRRDNIAGIAYNTRFLILPWVKVPNLASHLLSRMAKILSEQWEKLYNHPIQLLETFIDPTRFRGTCHRAANWIYLGLTTGRGKNDHTYKPNRSLKQLWVYPLGKDFRNHLIRGDE
ncbi:MAG TPA: DUF4338 domain-containing protein [Verrucomicrobiales bacterium]|nr:DUF4338 domain-containing protein [Verrucomicrobiales bacterium]